MQQRKSKKQIRVAKQYQHVVEKLKINDIQPLTYNQELAFDSYDDNYNLILSGFPGTGKTFLAMYFGLDELLSEETEYQKLIIIRNTVPTRNMGFLPGTDKEKSKVYESPYERVSSELFKIKSPYTLLKNQKLLEFETTSFLRGTQYDNSIIVIDEAQNMTDSEHHTIFTRIGKNSKFIMCCDINQNDLIDKPNEKTGLPKTLSVLRRIESVKEINFKIEDIVRSGFVKDYIIARSLLGYI